jgi:hypothetical protein
MGIRIRTKRILIISNGKQGNDWASGQLMRAFKNSNKGWAQAIFFTVNGRYKSNPPRIVLEGKEINIVEFLDNYRKLEIENKNNS